MSDSARGLGARQQRAAAREWMVGGRGRPLRGSEGCSGRRETCARGRRSSAVESEPRARSRISAIEGDPRARAGNSSGEEWPHEGVRATRNQAKGRSRGLQVRLLQR